MPLDDQIYPAQVWTIQELEGSYTIVGRGANRVLEGHEDLLNLSEHPTEAGGGGLRCPCGTGGKAAGFRR